VVAPNTDLWLTSYSDDTLTTDQVDAILTKTDNVVWFGVIRYDDIFGQHDSLRFCYLFNPDSKTFTVCEEHNETFYSVD